MRLAFDHIGSPMGHSHDEGALVLGPFWLQGPILGHSACYGLLKPCDLGMDIRRGVLGDSDHSMK
jgi:hypothetical protein